MVDLVIATWGTCHGDVTAFCTLPRLRGNIFEL
jgi:hypothetical protein